MSIAEKTHRARNLQEMGALQAKMFLPEQLAAGIANYKPRPTDIVIAPYAKCGTTWLQQTFHCLRTRGDMDFDDISRVVPWIETSVMLGLDLEAPQVAEPRGFKSHLAYDQLPRGARYVVSFRHPKDAFVSFHHFMEGWFFEPGTISLAELIEMRLARQAQPQSYWHHLMSWWEQRDNPNVLLFSYEQMSADPEGTIRALAEFAGIPLDDGLLKLTLVRSSLDYMLAHKDKFDDLMMRKLSETRAGLPEGGDAAKVRQGKVGANAKELPAEIARLLDAKWAESVGARFGFADYAAFDAALREHRKKAVRQS